MTPEMYYIEESQTWICPFGGRWKVICVGGGASGEVATTTGTADISKAWSDSGGATSFGTALVANGGTNSEHPLRKIGNSNYNNFGGYGGYDGFNYGGKLTLSENSSVYEFTGNGGESYCTGRGWGAGGGGKQFQSAGKAGEENINATVYGTGGFNGELKTTIVNIDEGEQIPCTVGKGGLSGGFTEEKALEMFSQLTGKTVTSFAISLEDLNKSLPPARDGVIILQYLGV